MAQFYATNPPRFKHVPPAVPHALAGLPHDYYVCLEFDALKDFDVAILHPRGIHVIEVKNYRNVVQGGPHNAQWVIGQRRGITSI
jgi:hypothetical protein